MHWYWQSVGKDTNKWFFVIFQLSNGPWLMSEFCFHLISWEQFDGVWWHFVYEVFWPTHEIFPEFFQQSYGPWLMSIVHLFSISLEIINVFWWNIVHALIYMIHVVTDTNYFTELFKRVMTLDWFSNYVYAQYLVTLLVDLIKSGRFIDMFWCKNMCNNKNEHCGGVGVGLGAGGISRSACNALIDLGFTAFTHLSRVIW